MKNHVKPIKIGDLYIKNNIFLAPLAGVADSSFRAVCKDFGAGLCYSEMISSKGVHYKSKGSAELGRHLSCEEPFAVQLFGNDPEIMAEAARFFVDNGAKLIDVNFGCPVPKVTGNLEGSYLLNDIPLMGRIIENIAKNVSVPVTCKMRRGYNSPNEVAPEAAYVCQESGAAAVTVHGRFRDQFYSGKSDRGVIRRVKERLTIPVIASGDVVSPETACQTFDETGCDAIMIGRGALGHPWIFEEILSGSSIEKTPREIRDVILRQFNLSLADKGERIAVNEIRKHVAWYVKGMHNASSMKNDVFSASTVEELYAVLDTIAEADFRV